MGLVAAVLLFLRTRELSTDQYVSRLGQLNRLWIPQPLQSLLSLQPRNDLQTYLHLVLLKQQNGREAR